MPSAGCGAGRFVAGKRRRSGAGLARRLAAIGAAQEGQGGAEIADLDIVAGDDIAAAIATNITLHAIGFLISRYAYAPAVYAV